MKTTFKKTLSAIALLCVCGVALAQNSTGEIKGLVFDEQHNLVVGAEIKVLQGGFVIKNAVTDINGNYSIKPLQPGSYEVLVFYTGYKVTRYLTITVEGDQCSYVDVDLEVNDLGIDVIIYATKPWEKPIVDKTYMTMHQLNFEQINQIAAAKGDVIGMIAAISSDVFVSEEGGIFSRGSRVGSSKYYVDGDVLPFDTEVSGMSIQNLSVITGGIPAQYGDLTGAVIVINTRDYFSGIAEKNIRNSNYKQKEEQEKKDAEYEEQKKKREKEIEEEKKKQAMMQEKIRE